MIASHYISVRTIRYQVKTMVQIPEKVLAKMAEQTTVKTLVTASACGAPHAIVCGSIIAPAADKVVVGEVLMKRASANLQANPKAPRDKPRQGRKNRER